MSEIEKEQCGNCKFFLRIGKNMGNCRRYPLKVFMLMEEGSTLMPDYRWPYLSEVNWCGEYQPCPSQKKI